MNIKLFFYNATFSCTFLHQRCLARYQRQSFDEVLPFAGWSTSPLARSSTLSISQPLLLLRPACNVECDFLQCSAPATSTLTLCSVPTAISRLVTWITRHSTFAIIVLPRNAYMCAARIRLHSIKQRHKGGWFRHLPRRLNLNGHYCACVGLRRGCAVTVVQLKSICKSLQSKFKYCRWTLVDVVHHWCCCRWQLWRTRDSGRTFLGLLFIVQKSITMKKNFLFSPLRARLVNIENSWRLTQDIHFGLSSNVFEKCYVQFTRIKGIRVVSWAGLSGRARLGLGLSKCFGAISDLRTQRFSQRRTLFSPVTVEVIELIESSVKMINCEVFSHVDFPTPPLPRSCTISTHSVN